MTHKHDDTATPDMFAELDNTPPTVTPAVEMPIAAPISADTTALTASTGTLPSAPPELPPPPAFTITPSSSYDEYTCKQQSLS